MADSALKHKQEYIQFIIILAVSYTFNLSLGNQQTSDMKFKAYRQGGSLGEVLCSTDTPSLVLNSQIETGMPCAMSKRYYDDMYRCKLERTSHL